jgi:hypothetical protein
LVCKAYFDRGTVAGLVTWCRLAGAGLATGENFMGLYSSAGVLIAKTIDLSAVMNSTGVKTLPLTVEPGQSLTMGGGTDPYVFVAMLANGSTPWGLKRWDLGDGEFVNVGLDATDGYRSGVAATGQATLPASFTPTGLGNTGSAAVFAGLYA